MPKKFDLNIERILEHWGIQHAIREIIANALDEQTITKTENINIYKDGESWHIRDYGRGLKYNSLTQNENVEKLNNDALIGRFGIGLKDALATFFRYGVTVKIKSKYNDITLQKEEKSGFSDITTLHAIINEPSDPDMQGTDVILINCPNIEVDEAKNMFLVFQDIKPLESTKYGQVFPAERNSACIYLNGLRIAEEPHFLFSYNITSLQTSKRKELNRERTNVGRKVYMSRVQDILLECKNDRIIQLMVQETGYSPPHEDFNSSKMLSHIHYLKAKAEPETTYVRKNTALSHPEIIDKMRIKGKQPFIVEDSVYDDINRINNKVPTEQQISNEQTFKRELADEQYAIISPDSLSDNEKRVFASADTIMSLIGGKPFNVKEIQIAEDLGKAENCETLGLWDSANKRILIKRSQLCNAQFFSRTLIHECCHANSHKPDVNREFENELTKVIGTLAAKLLLRRGT